MSKKVTKKTNLKEGTLAYSLTMIALVIIIAIASYFVSELSNIQVIHVQGNTEISKEEIIEYTPIKVGDSIWDVYFRRDQATKTLADRHPQIKSGQLELKDMNEYILTVEELGSMGYLEREETYYKVLDDGEVLTEEYPTPGGGSPVFENFDDEEVFKDFSEQFKQLPNAVTQLISVVQYAPNESNDSRLLLTMNDGNAVKASIPSFSERMSYYTAMLEAVAGEIGTFNLETGAYFTPHHAGEDGFEEIFSTNVSAEENTGEATE